MKLLLRNISVISATILALMLCLAGCTTSPSLRSAPVTTPVATPTAQIPTATGTAVPGTYLTIANLSDGVAVTYAADWEMQGATGTGLRDYGRTTRNIANLYSPAITPDEARSAEPNPDESRYTVLSIDVEPEPVTNFEGYFHNASLALDGKYLKYKITKHNYQLQMSVTDDFSGYPAYQLNFDGTGVRGSYIFTNAGGKVYIFAFRNPSPHSVEVAGIIHSIRISP